jgi:hypothetical protein
VKWNDVDYEKEEADAIAVYGKPAYAEEIDRSK